MLARRGTTSCSCSFGSFRVSQQPSSLGFQLRKGCAADCRRTHFTHNRLPATIGISHALTMFVVTEAQAAMIRATYEMRGELSAAVELRQLFPGIVDNAQARLCVRTIAGWRPLPKRLRPVRLRVGIASR
jgi:hypothetical protein